MGSKKKFQGCGVAIVTPFRDNDINYDGLDRLVDHVVNGNVDFIVALGSTGEAATISDVETSSILDAVIQHTDGRVPIVAGNFAGNSTHGVCTQIKTYNFDGIDAILSASPAYNKPSQEGIYQHYMHIADASPVPVLLYNVPSRTSSNMTSETTLRLAESHDNIIGIKEASGDINQAKEIIRSAPLDFLVTSGDDVLAPAMIQAGGDGVISVLANAFPVEFGQMIHAYLDGKLTKGRELESLLYDLHHWMYVEGNPSGVKTALETLSVCSKDVRLPLTPVSADTYRNIVALVKAVKLRE